MGGKAEPSIMLLGPSEPLRPRRGSPTSCLGDFTSARREQVTTCQPYAPAFLMEDAAKLPAETYTQKFYRLVEERNVRTFSVLWPLHAKMNALSIELGFLLTGLAKEDLEPDQVELLVERGKDYRWDRTVRDVVLAEEQKGNRAFYYSDFAAFGGPIRRWGNKLALEWSTVDMALKHASRYPRVEDR